VAAKNKYFSSLLLLFLTDVLEIFSVTVVSPAERGLQILPFACPGGVFIDVSEGSYPSAVLSGHKDLLPRNMRGEARSDWVVGTQTRGASYELGNCGSDAHIMKSLAVLFVMPVTTKTLYWP
jgi:hypothetical protein